MLDDTEAIRVRLQFEAEQAEKRAKSLGRSIDALERKFDPVARATQKFDRSMGRLDKALEQGIVDTARYEKLQESLNADLKLAKDRANGAAGAIKTMNAATGRGSNMRAWRAQVQQAGFQVQDFFVQVQGGTSAVTAFTQQGSQMLGVFGMWGAVAGAALAIGLPLAASFFDQADGAAAAGEKVKTFTEKLESARSAIDAADAALVRASAGGVEDLEKIYGRVTEKVTALAAALADIEVLAAVRQVETALGDVFNQDFGDKLTEQVGGIAGAILETTGEDVQALKEEIAGLQQEIANAAIADPGRQTILAQMQEELAVLEGNIAAAPNLAAQIAGSPEDLNRIRELAVLIPKAVAAQEFQAAADGLSELRALLEDVGVETREGVVAEMTATEDLLRRIVQLMSDAGDEAGGIADGLSPAVAEAQKLADWLGIALSTARTLAALGPQGVPQTDANGKSYGGRGGDPRKFGGSAFDRQVAEADAFLASLRRPGRKRKGGRGGGGRGARRGVSPDDLLKNADRQLENLQRQIDMIGKTRSEVAALTLKYQLLDKAKAAGIDVDSARTASGKTLRDEIESSADAVGRLTEQYDAGQLSQKEFERGLDEVSQTLTELVFEADSFRDAIKQTLRGIAQDIVRSGIRAALQSVFSGFGGGSSGGGGGVFGKLFAGLFDSGGNIPAGQFGIAGERRPELVEGPTLVRGPARVTGGAATARMLNGAAAAGTVRLIIEEDTAFAARVRTEADGVVVERMRGAAQQQQQINQKRQARS